MPSPLASDLEPEIETVPRAGEPPQDVGSAREGVSDEPRTESRGWNVWELERRARARSGEWSHLLLHLREFARPDGTLPVEFDSLVRETLAEESPGERRVDARTRADVEERIAAVIAAARTEARDILAGTERDAAVLLREAEAAGAIRLERARREAEELESAARADVERTLEWARAQAEVIMQRARTGAEQLLASAGHGDPAIEEAVAGIVAALGAALPKRSAAGRAGEARASVAEDKPLDPKAPK